MRRPELGYIERHYGGRPWVGACTNGKGFVPIPRHLRALTLISLSFLGATILGCAKSVESLDVQYENTCIPCDHPACDTPLEVQYLGSGGFILKRGNDEIATGPFFSNPNIVRAALLSIETDADAVEKFMPNRPELSAILVGHAHYDHLMDIPEIIERKTPNATVYASETAAHLLAAAEPPLVVQLLNDRGWRETESQDWTRLPNTNVRFIGIESEHAPHLWKLKLMTGKLDRDLEKIPSRMGAWKEGQTYSFLIEFGDDEGQPEFRIHYQDSASRGGVGIPPRDLERKGDRKPYAILLPTVASWGNVSDYPDSLVRRLQPDYAVLGHWEDFFRPFTRDPKQLRSVRSTDLELFLKKMDGLMGREAYALPAPLTKFRFARTCR